MNISSNSKIQWYISYCYDLPADAPQPRGDDDGPGIGGPTPDVQAELGAEPTWLVETHPRSALFVPATPWMKVI